MLSEHQETRHFLAINLIYAFPNRCCSIGSYVHSVILDKNSVSCIILFIPKFTDVRLIDVHVDLCMLKAT